MARRRRETEEKPSPEGGGFVVEELEPRILLSTLTGAELEASLLAPDTATSGEVLEAPATPDSGDAGAETQAESTRRELVFVDTGVEGYEQLVEDLRASSSDDRSLEVVLLDSERDGIEQISEFLADYERLDAVHIVSHGSEGAVQLGDAWLSGDTLASYEGALASWADALSEEADLLFYGCDLAGGVSGQALVGDLAKLTGADVAASEDLTGSSLLGGDWELEVASGSVEAQSLFAAASEAAWTGTLEATATGGNILVLNIKKSQSFSPATLNREKPYAVNVPSPNARNVLIEAITMLFQNRFK